MVRPMPSRRNKTRPERAEGAPTPVLRAFAAAAFALAAMLYALTLRSQFVFDDIYQIVLNRSIQNLANPRAVLMSPEHQSRVVLNFSYALDWWVSGGREWSFHLTNIALHLVNAWLLGDFAVLPRRSAACLVAVFISSSTRCRRNR